VDLGATRRGRLALFGALYFAQGVPWGFVTLALVLRLTGMGMGPAEVGAIVAVALLPWTFKVVLGPLVDSLSVGPWGRRPLILGCEGAMAATVLALAFADPRRERLLFLALVFANSAFAALQDVLTDAIAIALLPEAERGRANGVMSAAKYGGTVAGGAGLAALAGHVGWPAAHVAAAILLLAPGLVVLALREPRRPAVPAGPALVRLLGQLPASFLQRTTPLVALFVLVAGASDSFLYPLVVSKLRLGLGLSDARMAGLASLAAIASMVGSLVGGWLSDALGRRRAIAVGSVTFAAAHLTFAALTRSVPVLIGYQLVSGVAGGVVYAATIALCMDVTNPRLPAMHFQSFMALYSVKLMWASRAGGQLAERLSVPAMFALAAGIEVAALLLLPLIDPRRAQERFWRGDGGAALSSDREAQGRRFR
jgi:PAT family beta-lactamase induction signal transducer AmpG